VLEELDAEDAVVCCWGESVVYDVAGDDCQVGEVFGLGLTVDVFLLGAGVGEACYLGGGELLGEVEGEGSPSAAGFLLR